MKFIEAMKEPFRSVIRSLKKDLTFSNIKGAILLSMIVLWIAIPLIVLFFGAIYDMFSIWYVVGISCFCVVWIVYWVCVFCIYFVDR